MSLDKSQAVNSANQYVLQHNVKAAVEIYQKIIESDPTDLTAIDTLGDLYAGGGRVQDAIAQFSRVAASYAEAGFTRKAIAALKKIIAVDPANIETAIKLADLYAQAGLPSEARHHYVQIAEALTRKGRMPEALSVYNKIVELDPLNTSGRIKLGELYLREGMNEQAFEAFVTAADQLAAGSENRRALNAYKEALAIRPDSVEVRVAAHKVSTLLGVTDPAKSVRNSATRSAEPVDLDRGNEPAPVASDLPDASTSLDQALPSADSFVVQEISKAEILVAYGQVDYAISMLRDVLREQPDSIDVHIKLKDIYLRAGMMAEAAQECVSLGRIYEGLGESERARDYAVRAGRLTQLLEQPSGDLPEPTPKPADDDGSRVDAAPATIPSRQAPATPGQVASRFDMRPAEPNRITIISVVSSDGGPIEGASPAPDVPPASQASSVETLTPAGEAELVGAPPGETALALSTGPPTAERDRALPVMFAGSPPVKRKRGRLAAATVAVAVFVLLSVSAVIGGFAYDAHLDKQYQALALASPSLTLPPPPPLLASDEPAPLLENLPITVVVTAPTQSDASAQRPNPDPEPLKYEPASLPQPTGEPAKTVTPPSPVPPRVEVSADNRAGTETRTPVGLPVGVPNGASQPPEPAPKPVRQSAGVVLGGAVKRVDPVYPAAAKDARQSGVVAVEVIINEQGNVTSARALSGPGLLRNAAVRAARAWKFKASTLGGVPVPTTTTIAFNFRL